MLRLLMIVVLAAGAARAAGATDIPGDRSTRATLPLSPSRITFQFEAAGDKDWHRLSLTKGQDYHVAWYAAFTDAKATLRDKTGAALSAGYSTAGYYRWSLAGFSFRAGYDGLHYLTLVAVGNDENSSSYSSPYSAQVTNDCASATLTKCQLPLNRVTNGILTSGLDINALSMNLSANQAYVLTVPSSDPVFMRLTILTGNGTPTASGSSSDSDGTIVTFQTAAVGRYFVQATGGQQSYSMLVKQR